MPQSLCNRLKCLELGITDETGPGPVNYHLRSLSENFDYDDGHPFSNLQLRHPNINVPMEQYPLFEDEPDWKLPAQCGATSGNEAHFFHFVSHCRNLESLGLVGNQFLNGDLLQ